MASALLLVVIVITLALPVRLARRRAPRRGLRRLLVSYATMTAIWAVVIARYYIELAMGP